MRNQKGFTDFNLNEFIWNDYFRKWVLSADELSDNFWKVWINENPAKKEVIINAKRVIEILAINEIELSDEVIAIEIKKILDEIDNRHFRNFS